MKNPKSKTHYTDKTKALKNELINLIRKSVKKYGTPNIIIAPNEDAYIKVDFESNVAELTAEEYWIDQNQYRIDYDALSIEDLGILADYVNNI